VIGSCGGMFTANTMAVAIGEALGMSLPGFGVAQAGHRSGEKRDDYARRRR
jgi:dihydroxyacid dehydratase/phosphogluconate dehydratase